VVFDHLSKKYQNRTLGSCSLSPISVRRSPPSINESRATCFTFDNWCARIGSLNARSGIRARKYHFKGPNRAPHQALYTLEPSSKFSPLGTYFWISSPVVEAQKPRNRPSKFLSRNWLKEPDFISSRNKSLAVIKSLVQLNAKSSDEVPCPRV
jgi:hypothetical protein